MAVAWQRLAGRMTDGWLQPSRWGSKEHAGWPIGWIASEAAVAHIEAVRRRRVAVAQACGGL